VKECGGHEKVLQRKNL
jgi:hypothetical protein